MSPRPSPPSAGPDFKTLAAQVEREAPENLAALLKWWQKEMESAVATGSAKPASKALEEGLKQALHATFAAMNAGGWNGDRILEAMFNGEPKPAAHWSRELALKINVDSDPERRRWWIDAQERILSEVPEAVRAAETPNDRVTNAVEALIGESFAASVIGVGLVGLRWDDIVL